MFFEGGFTFANFLLDVFVVFLFVIWIWLLITVFSDLFRRRDVSGWAKAFWVIFLLVLPYLGVLVYLITQGTGMTERSIQQVQHAFGARPASALRMRSRSSRRLRNPDRSPIRNSRSFVPSWFSRQTARPRVGRSQRGGATRLEL